MKLEDSPVSDKALGKPQSKFIKGSDLVLDQMYIITKEGAFLVCGIQSVEVRFNGEIITIEVPKHGK